MVSSSVFLLERILRGAGRERHRGVQVLVGELREEVKFL